MQTQKQTQVGFNLKPNFSRSTLHKVLLYPLRPSGCVHASFHIDYLDLEHAYERHIATPLAAE